MKRILFLLFATLATSPLFADADLFLHTASNPSRWPAGSSFAAGFDITNLGPDTAQGTTVTVDFPETVTNVYVALTGFECQGTTHFRCSGSLAGLPPSYTRSIYVQGIAPASAGTLDITATISSETPDPQPQNNSATRRLEISTSPNLVVSLANVPARVDPGQAFQIDVAAYNGAALNAAHNVRLHLEAQGARVSASSGPWSCALTGGTADCKPDDDADIQPLKLTLVSDDRREGGVLNLRASISSDVADFADYDNQYNAKIEAYRWISVISSDDSGPGTLRQAIVEANQNCSPGPCRIVFEIPQFASAKWVTIAPQTPLPVITADRLIVDGTRQTTFTGDTNPDGPEVFLDGSASIDRAIQFRAKCDAQVRGLAIGNFTEHAVVIAGGRRCTRGDALLVEKNYIGTDPTGTIAQPNLRGVDTTGAIGARIESNLVSGNILSAIWVYSGATSISGNRIGTQADGETPLPNGKSGVFLGPDAFNCEVLFNVISYNVEMGVAEWTGARGIDIRQNSMRANGGLGIDIGLDGPTAPRDDDRAWPSNPPILLNARYDPSVNVTYVTGIVRTKPLGPYLNYVLADFYVNDAPDGDGERWIGSRNVRPGETFTFVYEGNLEGKWITGTSSRVHFVAAKPPAPDSYAGGETSTSEMSHSLQVNHCIPGSCS